MNRAECEQQIFEKAIEIKEIIENYKPGCGFFNLAIHDGCISFFNEHWVDGNDADKPIDFYKNLEEEEDEV